MNRSRWLWIFFGLLILATGVQLICFCPQLPERLASRFDGHGKAIEWCSKASFLRSNLVVFLLVVLLFPVLWIILPWIPASMINVPHKDFWLAPERYAYGLTLVRDFLLCMGCLTLMCVAAFMHVTMRANLTAQPNLGYAPWIIVGLYLSLVLGSVAWFFRKPGRWF